MSDKIGIYDKNYQCKQFGCIVYPESLEFNNVDLISTLNNLNLVYILSPLHSPDDLQSKKHYHLLLLFEKVKTLNTVQKILFNNFYSKIIEPINDLNTMIRYLLHRNPKDSEKEQFNGNYIDLLSFSCDVKLIDEAFISSTFSLSTLFDYCIDNEISNIGNLITSFKDNNTVLELIRKNRNLLIDFLNVQQINQIPLKKIELRESVNDLINLHNDYLNNLIDKEEFYRRLENLINFFDFLLS